LTRRVPSIAVDVGVQACSAPVSESPAVNVGLVSQSQRLGAPSGIPLPTSVGPLVLPMGPEIVACPPTESQLEFGAVRVHCGYSTCRPTGKRPRTLVHTSVAYRHGYSTGPSLPEFGATVGAHVCAR